MNFSYLIMVSFLMVWWSSFNNDFPTSQTFEVFDGRFFRENGNLVIIIRRGVKAPFLMGDICNVEENEMLSCRAIRRNCLANVIFLRAKCGDRLVREVISKEDVRLFNLQVVLFNFFGIACVRITIAGAVMYVNGYNYVFAFLRLGMFLRVVTYLHVIFPIRDSVPWIVVNGHVRFIVKLNNRLRVDVGVAYNFCRSI